MTLRKAWPSKAVQADADDMRYNLRGNVVRDAAGVPRRGLLGYRPGSLVTSLGSMKVRVASFDAVTARDGGAVFLANDGVWDVTLDAAPAANSRIDVLYAKQNDSTATVGTPDPADGGDANQPVFVVVKGTAAPVPQKPATVPEGGVELATITLPAGAAATNSVGVVITQTHQFTAMTGGVVPVRSVAERDNGFAWAEGTTIRIVNSGELQVRGSAGWSPVGGSLPYVQDTRTSAMLVGSGVDHNVITVTLPRAGRWLVECQGTFEANVNGTRRSLIKLDGDVVATRGVGPSATSGAGMNISDIVTATRDGATLAFNVYQTSGAVLNMLADSALWKIAIRAQFLSAV